MTSSLSTERLYTAADLSDLPDDGFRYELVGGLLIRDQPPGFDHGAILINVAQALHAWARSYGAGTVSGGDPGYRLRTGPDTVRAPDVSFVRADRLAQGRPTGFLDGAPDLAVEVMSPHDRMSDILDKVSDYFEAGAEQVWVVVPRNRTVMIHRSLQDVVVLNEQDVLVGDGVLEGLRVAVTDIFA